MADSLTTVATAQPYPFAFPRGRTALVIIDMQRDFVEAGQRLHDVGAEVRRRGLHHDHLRGVPADQGPQRLPAGRRGHRGRLRPQPLEGQHQFTAQFTGAEYQNRCPVYQVTNLPRRLLAPSANLPSTQSDVDVAPPPALPRLDRAHHGMARATVVLVGVLVRTGITTADLSAGQTHPKVRPRILPKCRTVTTAAGRLRLRFSLADGVGEVRAGGRGIFFTRTRCP